MNNRVSKWFYLSLSIMLAALSAAFSFYIFKLVFHQMPFGVPLAAATLVASLQWGMSWYSDDKRALVWGLAVAVSVLTTVLSIALGTISSGESARVAKVVWGAVEKRQTIAEEDQQASQVWQSANRVTKAAAHRRDMSRDIATSVQEAKDAASISQGEALISIAMSKVPEGLGPFVVGILALLVAVLLDLGSNACIKTVMEPGEEPPRRLEKKVNRTKSRTKSDGRPDTGTSPGANGRYSLFVEGVRAGEIKPNTEAVKKACSCGYTTARAYLDQAAQDGILLLDESGRGRKYTLR